MDKHGLKWIKMEPIGFKCIPMYQWTQLDPDGYQCIQMDSNEFHFQPSTTKRNQAGRHKVRGRADGVLRPKSLCEAKIEEIND